LCASTIKIQTIISAFPTTGTPDHRYVTPSGTPKPVNVLSEVVSSPRIDAGKLEKQEYVEFLNGYIV